MRFNNKKIEERLTENRTAISIYDDINIKKIPIIGNYKIKTQFLILMFLTFFSFIILSISLFTYIKHENYKFNISSEYLKAIKNTNRNIIIGNDNFNLNNMNSVFSFIFKNNDEEKPIDIFSKIIQTNDNIASKQKEIEAQNNLINLISNDSKFIQEKIPELNIISENIDFFVSKYSSNQLLQNDFSKIESVKNYIQNSQNKVRLEPVSRKLNFILENKKQILDNQSMFVSRNKDAINVLSYFEKTQNSLNAKNVSLFYYLIIIFSLLLLLLFSGLIIMLYMFEKQKITAIDLREAKILESTILVLLDEITPYKDGDFRKSTTVADNLIGNVANELNLTFKKLDSLIRAVKENSLDLIQKSQYSFEKTNNMNTEILDQYDEITDVKETFDKFNEIKQNLNNEVEVTKNVSDININTATFASVAVQNLNNIVKTIIESTNDLKSIMEDITVSSDDTKKVLDFLSDISEEISVLSTNASLQSIKSNGNEAETLIAKKIKELSSNSKTMLLNAKEILNRNSLLINKINNNVNKTNNIISNALDTSKDVDISLEKIKESSKNLEQVILQLTNIVEEQSIITDSTNTKMNKVFDSVNKLHISIKESIQTSELIKKQSSELKKSVDIFIID